METYVKNVEIGYQIWSVEKYQHLTRPSDFLSALAPFKT